MSRSTHFTIFEAWVAIYPTNDDDQVTGDAVFTGCGCWEQVVLGRSYTEKRRPFLGESFVRSYNEDEAHTIELVNPLEVGASLEIKQLDRFGRYAAVVLWHDEERMVWLKRTYYGVTDATEQVGGTEAESMKTDLRAERVVQVPGSKTWPTLEPDSQFGTVYYVKAGVRQALYGMGDGGEFFELPGFDATHGLILPAEGSLGFYVEGTLAMLALWSGTVPESGTGLFVNGIVATGGSFLDTAQAVLEFDINGTRVATLAKDGTLAVPDVAEADVRPGHPTDIVLLVPPLGAWAGSIGLTITTAQSLSEFLNP